MMSLKEISYYLKYNGRIMTNSDKIVIGSPYGDRTTLIKMTVTHPECRGVRYFWSVKDIPGYAIYTGMFLEKESCWCHLEEGIFVALIEITYPTYRVEKIGKVRCDECKRRFLCQ